MCCTFGHAVTRGYWFGKHFEPALDSLESKHIKGTTVDPVDAMRKAETTYGKKTSKRKRNDVYELSDSRDDESEEDEDEVPITKRRKKNIIESDEEETEKSEEAKWGEVRAIRV
jgi:hypothetical protein